MKRTTNDNSSVVLETDITCCSPCVLALPYVKINIRHSPSVLHSLCTYLYIVTINTGKLGSQGFIKIIHLRSARCHLSVTQTVSQRHVLTQLVEVYGICA